MIKENKNCYSCPSLDQGIFCELTKTGLHDIIEQKFTSTFKKGEKIFSEGDPSVGIYCIRKGTVKLTKMGKEGKESIVRILKGGDMLGHRSLFSSQDLHASATALEATEICFINKKFIMQIVETNPKIAFQIIQSVSKQLGASEQRIAELTQKNVKERVAGFLLLLAETHGQKTDTGILISLKLTREELASLVGTATETVIRVISDFKKDNLINQKGRYITITDIEELVEVSCSRY